MNQNSQNEPSLKIVRTFNVEPQVVFDAFTKPEAMKVWWELSTTFDINLEVGGTWTIVRTEEDGKYTATGKYLEVDAPNRLSYTYSMPQFSPNTDVITIDIVATENGGSEMTFIVSGPDIAAELKQLPEGNTSESEMGWQQGFDLMANAFSRI